MKGVDCTLSAFELFNDRGLYAPIVTIDFTEKDDGRQWLINAGAHRAYVMEFGAQFGNLSDKTIEETAVNAHLFVQQVCACLLVIGCGLFKFRAVARILMKSVQMASWEVDLRPNDVHAKIKRGEIIQKSFVNWFVACSRERWMRRAIEDLYNSLISPKEASVFVYRGLEWIKNGLGMRWEELVKYVDLPPKEIKAFTRMLNDPEVAVRHGTKSGKKMRASSIHLSSSATLLEIVNGIRAEREQGYQPLTPAEMGQAIARGAPVVIFD
jgi:hypothetical protein